MLCERFLIHFTSQGDIKRLALHLTRSLKLIKYKINQTLIIFIYFSFIYSLIFHSNFIKTKKKKTKFHDLINIKSIFIFI